MQSFYFIAIAAVAGKIVTNEPNENNNAAVVKAVLACCVKDFAIVNCIVSTFSPAVTRLLSLFTSLNDDE